MTTTKKVYIYGLNIEYTQVDDPHAPAGGETFIYSDEPLYQIGKRQVAKSIAKELGVSTYKVVNALHLYTLPDGSPAQEADLFITDPDWSPPPAPSLDEICAALSDECETSTDE